MRTARVGVRTSVRRCLFAAARAAERRGDKERAEQLRTMARRLPTVKEMRRYGIS